MLHSTQTGLLKLRKSLLDPQDALTYYVARADYLQHSTWLQVPVFDTKLNSTAHIGVLCDKQWYSLYTSTIIGKVNTDDLFVHPQGDCINPADISTATLRLSLSSPEIPETCIFDRDFGVALQHLKELAISANAPDIPAKHMVNIQELENRICFYYPLMYDRYSVCRDFLSFHITDFS